MPEISYRQEYGRWTKDVISWIPGHVANFRDNQGKSGTVGSCMNVVVYYDVCIPLQQYFTKHMSRHPDLKLLPYLYPVYQVRTP